MHTIPGVLAVIWSLGATGDLPPSTPALLASRMQALTTAMQAALERDSVTRPDLDTTAAALDEARKLTRDPIDDEQLARWAIALRDAATLGPAGRAARLADVRAGLGRRILRWRFRIESRPPEKLGNRRPATSRPDER